MVHPFFKISPLKRMLSYLVPVTIANSYGKQNKFLEFILYRNQWQLATEDALYSDGTRYEPFKVAFKNAPKDVLNNTSDCLILGTGLGSIVQILASKYKCRPNYTLVEYDETILNWAVESLTAMGIDKLRPYSGYAEDFVKEDKGRYDLLCIDIFTGREVPVLFTEADFLVATKRLLKPGGLWIMNYIVNDTKETMQFLGNVKSLFPNVEIIEKNQNMLLIAQHL
jgi:spermidine synthase